MELTVYFWVEDVTAFIRELIRYLRVLLPDKRMVYEEEYHPLDNILDRDIYIINANLKIGVYDYWDISYISEDYGTDVNVYLMFDDADLGKAPTFIANIVNWIMRRSDTDLAIEDEGGMLNFKRVNGKIYYGKESDFWPIDYIPVKDLDFDREEAIEFTHDDKWVFCSEEHIQKMERWRKQQEKSEKAD